MTSLVNKQAPPTSGASLHRHRRNEVSCETLRAKRIWELPTALETGQIGKLAPGVMCGFDGVTLVDLPMGAAFAPLHKLFWRFRMRRRGENVGLFELAWSAVKEVWHSCVRVITEFHLRNNLRRLAMVPRGTQRVLHLSAQMRSRRQIHRRASYAVTLGVNEFMVISGGGIFQQIDRLWRQHFLLKWCYAWTWKPLQRITGRINSVGILEELGNMRENGELPSSCRISFVVNPNHACPEIELKKLRAKAEAVRRFNPEFTGVRLYAQPTLYAFDPLPSSDAFGWKLNDSADAAYQLFYEEIYRDILPTSVELIIGVPAFASHYQVDFWSYLVGRSDARAKELFESYHRVYDPMNKAEFLNLRDRWIEAAVQHGHALAQKLGLSTYGFIFQPATRTLTTKPFQTALDHLDRIEAD